MAMCTINTPDEKTQTEPPLCRTIMILSFALFARSNSC